MKKIYFLLVALLLTLSAGAQTIPGWTSTNTADGSSSSTTYVLVVSAGSTLTFDWEVGSESNYDWFTITLDGNEKVKKSGVDSGTYTYEFTAPGTHTLVAQYTKDDSKNDNGDYGKIYNINLTVPAAPSTPAGKKGDVNNDGVVNVGDVTSLVDVILYGDEEEPDTPIVPEGPATGEAIDLGLSVKWASCNVGATAPEEYGGYYAWGETEEKSSYNESDYLYYSNGSYTNIGSDISGTEYDVAHVQWGGSWRMPTLDEQKELINNCTWTRTTLNGVHGYRVTGPNGNSIFLPAAGSRSGEEVYHQGSYGYYWSSTLYSNYSNGAYLLHFDGSYYDWEIYSYRYCGYRVRPVCGTPVNYYTVNITSEAGGSALTSNGGISITVAANNNVTITATADTGFTFAGWYNGETLVSTETTYTFIPSENITLTAKFTPAITTGEAIDLGLSVKWASCNVGATNPEEYGGYYAWGETEEKSSYNASDYLYSSNGSYTNIGSDISGTEYDVAHVKWGGSWRMPTLDEVKELKNNCTWEWTTLNGVNGYRVTGPNGNSIFLSAAGRRRGEEVSSQGSYGYYWSSTLLSSDSSYAYYLYFYSSYYSWYIYFARHYGNTVRPVSE